MSLLRPTLNQFSPIHTRTLNIIFRHHISWKSIEWVRSLTMQQNEQARYKCKKMPIIVWYIGGIKLQPSKWPEQSQKGTVFDHSNIMMVGWNPSGGMDICLHFFCANVVLSWVETSWWANLSSSPTTKQGGSRDHPDWGSSWLSLALQPNSGIVCQIRPWPFASTSFPIHYLLTIRQFDVTYTELPTVLSNEPQINYKVLWNVLTDA
jgi:hypothetical protein